MIRASDFTGADISGCNFRHTRISADTKFESVQFDEHTNFDHVRGPRALSRLPIFAAYDYADGVFRKHSRSQSQEGNVRINLSGVEAVGVVGQIRGKVEPGVQGIGQAGTSPTSIGSLNQGVLSADASGGAVGVTTIDEIGGAAGVEVVPNPAIETVVSQIKSDPQAFESIARFAARTIRRELDALATKIPNEPAALDGYNHVRGVLEDLESGFDELASSVQEASVATDPLEQTTLLTKAVEAAWAMSEGFIDWLNQNGNHAGRVIAELGVAGAIAGALSFFVGVPPAMSFTATVAAMKGKSIWDAIVLFAPSNKKTDDKAD